MKSSELAMKEAQCGFQFATIWRLNKVQRCKPRPSECNPMLESALHEAWS